MNRSVDLQTAMLSSYPQAKLMVTCDTCGLNVRYDKLDMLEAGGDRPLAKLLEAIVRRNGCTLKESIPAYDKCGAIYANLPAAEKQNPYAKAKGGL